VNTAAAQARKTHEREPCLRLLGGQEQQSERREQDSGRQSQDEDHSSARIKE
jgi:hypothetical protein